MDAETTIQLRDPGKDNNGLREHDANFHSKYKEERGEVEEEEEEQEKEGEDRWKRLLDKYWEKSSISGVPFITSTKYTIVRIIWTALLIFACVAMIFHLVYLSAQYFSYDKQSKIDLEFKNLPFPAVTVCNANPFRLSKLSLASPRLQNLVKAFNPKTLREAVSKWETKYKPTRPPLLGSGVPDGLKSGDKNDTEDDFRDSNFFDDFEVSDFLASMATEAPLLSSGLGSVDGNNNTPILMSSTPRVTADQIFKEEFPDTWEAESEPSSFGVITQFLRVLFTSEPMEVRQKIGHRIQDMLVQCSFNGRRCLQRHFTKDISGGYGNCYTLQHEKFVASKNGPQSGLELILYLELDEYLHGITNSRGLQVVIHEPGTLPFPDDQGIAIEAGTNTYIGLKMAEIQRLGKPHGQCTPIDVYQDRYGVTYTRQICQKICLMESIWADCRCYDSSTLMLNKLVEIPKDLSPCTASEEGKACIQKLMHLFQNRSRTCKCDNPCREMQYRQLVSARQWPTADFAKVIVSSICRQDPYGRPCDHLTRKTDENLKNEFVRLNIFYEDLNYERIEENPDYKTSQFLSDVGGTIGLWIGLSLLSLFEIFHLVIHAIIIYFCPQKKRSFSKRFKYPVKH